MTSSDPISDMLTRIRNAQAVHKNTVRIPYSRMKLTIAKVLVDTGFIDKVEEKTDSKFKELLVTINAIDQAARITKIERVSKPGRRAYAKADEIPTVLRGRGVMVVSTSKGVMTGDQAKKQRLGGELICKVY